MNKIDYKKEYEKMFDTSENIFKIGDLVRIERLCDVHGNEIEENIDTEETDDRGIDLFKEGKINFVFGRDLNEDFEAGYTYGIEGSDYCFNKFELELVEE